MTRDEATTEARKRWGDTGGANVQRDPGRPNLYVVGCLGISGRPYVLGEGKDFAAAFADADARGHTSEAVRGALKKAERRLKRQRAWAGIAGLFR